MGWIGSEFSNFFIFTFFDFFFPSLHPSLHIIILHPPPHVISLCLPFAPVLKLLRLRLGRFFVFVLLLGFGELFNWEGLLFFIFLFIFTLLGLGQCPGSDFFFLLFFSIFAFQTQTILHCDWTETTVSLPTKIVQRTVMIV